MPTDPIQLLQQRQAEAEARAQTLQTQIEASRASRTALDAEINDLVAQRKDAVTEARAFQRVLEELQGPLGGFPDLT